MSVAAAVDRTISFQRFQVPPHQAPFRTLSSSLLIGGDAGQALDLLPDASVQTVITSPPYWSLRDYGVTDQIGRNDGLPDYVAAIIAVFTKLQRVLRPDGTVWLNVGDSYTSGNRRYRAPDRKNGARAMPVRPPTPDGLKPKDLIGVPWRLAFALQTAGWWLRSEVIWHKPNAHPESVRDRPTKAHETLFLLSRQQDYFYNIQAVQGPNGRRLRTVWDIPTEPQRGPDAASCRDAVGPGTSLCSDYRSSRWRGTRSLCRIRYHTAGGRGTGMSLGRH